MTAAAKRAPAAAAAPVAAPPAHPAPGPGGAATPACLYCDRDCDACGYPIDGGWEHDTRRFDGGVLTCTARRVTRPLADILPLWFEHTKHREA